MGRPPGDIYRSCETPIAAKSRRQLLKPAAKNFKNYCENRALGGKSLGRFEFRTNSTLTVEPQCLHPSRLFYAKEKIIPPLRAFTSRAVILCGILSSKKNHTVFGEYLEYKICIVSNLDADRRSRFSNSRHTCSREFESSLRNPNSLRPIGEGSSQPKRES